MPKRIKLLGRTSGGLQKLPTSFSCHCALLNSIQWITTTVALAAVLPKLLNYICGWKGSVSYRTNCWFCNIHRLLAIHNEICHHVVTVWELLQ